MSNWLEAKAPLASVKEWASPVAALPALPTLPSSAGCILCIPSLTLSTLVGKKKTQPQKENKNQIQPVKWGVDLPVWFNRDHPLNSSLSGHDLGLKLHFSSELRHPQHWHHHTINSLTWNPWQTLLVNHRILSHSYQTQPQIFPTIIVQAVTTSHQELTRELDPIYTPGWRHWISLDPSSLNANSTT